MSRCPPDLAADSVHGGGALICRQPCAASPYHGGLRRHDTARRPPVRSQVSCSPRSTPTGPRTKESAGRRAVSVSLGASCVLEILRPTARRLRRHSPLVRVKSRGGRPSAIDRERHLLLLRCREGYAPSSRDQAWRDAADSAIRESRGQPRSGSGSPPVNGTWCWDRLARGDLHEPSAMPGGRLQTHADLRLFRVDGQQWRQGRASRRRRRAHTLPFVARASRPSNERGTPTNRTV